MSVFQSAITHSLPYFLLLALGNVSTKSCLSNVDIYTCEELRLHCCVFSAVARRQIWAHIQYIYSKYLCLVILSVLNFVLSGCY